MTIWYAIITSPQRENAVRQILKRSGEDVFWPARVHRTRSRKAKLGKRRLMPLLPGYVFVEAPDFCTQSDALALWLHKVKSTKHVRQIVSVADRPCPIAGWKIERWRGDIRSHFASEKARLETTKIRKGSKARFKSGHPYAGKEGMVTMTKGKRTKLMAWLFGEYREVEAKTNALEAA